MTDTSGPEARVAATARDWRGRFTADQIFDATVAAGRPDRGLVLASRGGVMAL